MNEPDEHSAAAASLLDKLSAFITELTSEERQLLAALLAPGIGRAYEEDEVAGFGLVGWSPSVLPDALAREIQDRQLRIEID